MALAIEEGLQRLGVSETCPICCVLPKALIQRVLDAQELEDEGKRREEMQKCLVEVKTAASAGGGW